MSNHQTPAAFIDALTEANAHGLLSHPKDEQARRELTGLSGTKLIGALQRLARLFQDDPTACYLEVGVFQGLTLNSVACANPSLSCYGIDNFAFFDPRSENLKIVQQRMATLGNDNAELINADYEDAFAALAERIGQAKVAVYFVDGPHDYRSQLMCLLLAMPYLHERAVIVVDDANYEHVRQANADFLATHPDWRLIAQAYTSAHPKNMTVEDRDEAERGWWNGVNVLCRDPEHTQPVRYPPTRRSRDRFEDDHVVHAHRMAPFVRESLRMSSAIANGQVVRFVRELRRTTSKILKNRNAVGKFEAMNTDTERLPSFEIAAGADAARPR